MLIYVHGFNSSALSYKAGLVRRRMVELRRNEAFLCPELPPSPREAIGVLQRTIEAQQAGAVSLIGSSLGGYYATWLAERYGLRAALVNPAVAPYKLLGACVGPQQNLYTGVRYDFEERFISELRGLEVEHVTPSHYLLLVCTGDEVLDARDAMRKYRGCEQIVVEGGDHGFGDFEDHLGRVFAFCGVTHEPRA